MELWGKVGEEAQERKDACTFLAREHERRVMESQAQDRLARLSEPERAALAQAIQADGIESQESVNGG
jgi:hypothetical protein